MQAKPAPSSTPISEPSSPKCSDLLLGKYKLGRLLGKGSFAKVFCAQSLKDESSVAIKIIDKAILQNNTMEAQLLREVAVMHRLQHPNIVKIHEVMATKTKIYLVMEYVRGGDMFSKIVRRGRLTESMARRYFQQLVWTIQYCHVKGVVHRDIKPQNLLLDLDGNIKVSDFGLAALQEPGIKNGLLQTACGTPAYTAPEVVGRKGYDGVKADAWSCGIILFVFLAGFIPFDDSNILVMYRKIHRREFEYPPWFSRPVKRIISRLLDPNPDTRMSMEELLECSWLKQSHQSEPNLLLMGTPKFKDIKVDLVSSAPMMNAFEIISMSPGLNLSPLFEKGKMNEKRFTSTSSHKRIFDRVEETGWNLGYDVQRMEGGFIRLVKGRLTILVQVIEVAASLFLVHLNFGSGEDGELADVYWKDLQAGFGDIVTRHNEAVY